MFNCLLIVYIGNSSPFTDHNNLTYMIRVPMLQLDIAIQKLWKLVKNKWVA